MSIANPSTYAEWYWAQQVDATKTFADDTEKVLAPYIQGLLSLVSDLEGFPPELLAVLQAVGTPGSFGVADVAVGTMGQTAQGGITSGISPLLRAVGYAANAKWQTTFIKADTAALLASRHKAIPELWLSRAEAEGYNIDEAGLVYQSLLPYPDIMSLFQWARYTTDDTETFNRVQAKQDIPDEEFAIWDFMTRLRPSPSEVQALRVRNRVTEAEALLELRRQGYNTVDAQHIMDLGYVIPNATILMMDGVARGWDTTTVADELKLAGIHPDYADAFINATLTKPAPGDLVRYLLRSDPSLSTLEEELKKIGVHPGYTKVLKTLAYQVPPLGDMITMAVREAFTPEIAARFGQYEDYPSELTRYAAMNGLTEEWSQRYWAAHWSLPSPQQGFEMYQRGVIDEPTLNLLLRALDIMPFWRDKLRQIAYRPLTRVDVRRMYGLGVLDRAGIVKAYKDAGYSPDNADLMADFTAKQVFTSQSGMTVSKVVTAYKNVYANRPEAYSQIAAMGIRSQNVSDILEAADAQLRWQRVKDQIAAVGNQYKKELISEETTRSQLASLGQDGAKIDTLIRRWEDQESYPKETLWTKADTLTMLTKGIITEARAKQELTALGYNPERSTALISNAVKPKG